MNNETRKRILGLLSLYALLSMAASLVRQISYYGGLAVILLVIVLLILAILWRYLVRNNIITVTWGSMTYEANPHKSERLFLCALVILVSPVLRFHDLTLSDVIISGCAVVVAISGFLLNERFLYKKERQQSPKKE